MRWKRSDQLVAARTLLCILINWLCRHRQHTVRSKRTPRNAALLHTRISILTFSFSPSPLIVCSFFYGTRGRSTVGTGDHLCIYFYGYLWFVLFSRLASSLIILCAIIMSSYNSVVTLFLFSIFIYENTAVCTRTRYSLSFLLLFNLFAIVMVVVGRLSG